MSDGFTDLQDRVVELLAAHPYFTPETGKAITVLAEHLGDIENRIARNIGKLGISVAVMTPAGPIENAEYEIPCFRPKLVIGVMENAVLNRSATGTQQRAPAVALAVARLLHQNITAGDGFPFLTCQGIERDTATSQAIPNGTAYLVTFEVASTIEAPEPVRTLAGSETILAGDENTLAGAE